jgi:hypothetical protein
MLITTWPICRAELLRLRREADHGVDFARRQQLHGLVRGWGHECDVAAWVQPDVCGHAGHDEVMARPHARHGHGLALEVLHRADALGGEQLEAARVRAGQDHERVTRIDPQDELPAESGIDICLASCQGEVGSLGGLDILDVGKPFEPQELVSDELRRKAEDGVLRQPQPRRFGRRLRRGASGVEAQEPCRPHQRHSPQKPPPADLSSVLDTHGNLLSRARSVRHREHRPVGYSSFLRTYATPNAPGELRPTGEHTGNTPQSLRCGPSAPVGCSAGHTSAHPYRITSSAWKRSVGGMVRPRAWAVFRLMTSSNFIGCSTGRSAGFAPFRILSMYTAARRISCGRFVP